MSFSACRIFINPFKITGWSSATTTVTGDASDGCRISKDLGELGRAAKSDKPASDLPILLQRPASCRPMSSFIRQLRSDFMNSLRLQINCSALFPGDQCVGVEWC